MSGRIEPLAKFSDFLKIKLDPNHYRRLRQSLLPIYSRIPRIHWSQSGEDIILGALLPEAEGTYIDVGAAHPRLGSNTYFLYRRGWHGTLIEPNPQSARRLRKARPRDRILEAAAGATTGTTRFTIFESDYLSSMVPGVAQRRADAGEKVSAIVDINVVRLAELGLSVQPQDPSLLSIDCEGADLDVLKGIDWNVFQPRVICIEEHSGTLTDKSDIRSLLETRGYGLYAHTGLSAIYRTGN